VNLVHDRKPRHYTGIVRIGKSVAEVTNNIRLRSMYVILLKLTTARHEASRGLSATTELLVMMSRRNFTMALDKRSTKEN